MMDNTGIEQYIGREFEDGSWRKCFDSGEKWLERKKNQPPLTVVIPVYNGVEFLSRLLGALEQAPGIDSIILVDDHSPDPQTAALCAEWSQIALNRMCIRNARNLGFVRSVNIGIKSAPEKNDIILLNSDTVPSRQFAQRLKNAACSLPNVATVTPLSNAAGIFSVPIPKENNTLPPGWTVDQFATLLELVSGAPYEVIPSGSGFCLYITRTAIESVGVFDELLFERGYAEESDFCRRAAKIDFVNLMDMSTFVYHEREVSFGKEKDGLKKKNAKFLKILDTLYIAESLKWEKNTKLHKVCDNIRNLSNFIKQSHSYQFPYLINTSNLAQSEQHNHNDISTYISLRYQETINAHPKPTKKDSKKRYQSAQVKKSNSDYFYRLFLLHHSLLHESGMHNFPKVVAEVGPGIDIGVGLCYLLTGAEHYIALDIVKHADIEKSHKVLEDLFCYLMNKEPFGKKVFPDISHLLDEKGFPSSTLTDDRLRKFVTRNRVDMIKRVLEGKTHQDIRMDYVVPWTTNWYNHFNSVDLILSQSVMEHVDDLPTAYLLFKYMLKSSGWMSHHIDLKSHGITPEWDGHWGVSEKDWSIIKNQYSYLINRKPASFHINLINNYGFDIKRCMRINKKKSTDDDHIKTPWRSMDEEDRITSGLFLQVINNYIKQRIDTSINLNNRMHIEKQAIKEMESNTSNFLFKTKSTENSYQKNSTDTIEKIISQIQKHM